MAKAAFHWDDPLLLESLGRVRGKALKRALAKAERAASRTHLAALGAWRGDQCMEGRVVWMRGGALRGAWRALGVPTACLRLGTAEAGWERGGEGHTGPTRAEGVAER
jgi:hypothetical protein